MSVLNQKTLSEPINISGVGLHTGKLVNMKISPAEPNTGITFKRTDLKKNNLIIPNIFNVINTNIFFTLTPNKRRNTILHRMTISTFKQYSINN